LPSITFAEAWQAYRRAEPLLPAKPPPVVPRRISDIAAIAGDFDLIALDAWGVLNLGETPIPSARDAVARLGGEEFAILLPGRSARSALSLAERLRATVEGLRLSEGEELVHFTVSVGLSSLQPGEVGFEPMLRRADRALYKVKRSGRNRVLLADTEVAPVPSIPPARVIPDLQPVAAGGTERRVREFAG